MGVSESDPKGSRSNPEGEALPTTVDTTLVSRAGRDDAAPPRTFDREELPPLTLESAGPRAHEDEQRQVGRFEIEQLLGRGGQGKVWLAHDPVLGRRVAIKQLPKGTELTEARLSAAIEHPNVCRVYDFLSTDEHDFIVMEYVGGETLFKARRRGLKLDEALRILLQVARGLAAAHERGVVHRDLKSDNVMLTPFGVAKITDFGISSRDSEPSPSGRGLTGTPHSMSPEQSLGQATDARSDLFSFGVLCHELVAGESPFLGKDLQDTLHRVRVMTPPALHELVPHVPLSLSQLVQRLLAKSPKDRETSAEAVAQALQAIIDQSQRTGMGPGSGRGERRQVVLMACELTLAPGADDPELMLQFRQEYRRQLERAADEQGGSVQAAVGQQYVLCFGYPTPHEDSGLRAARAALRVKAWADAIGAAAAIAVRVAIHAGTAVILEHEGARELELGSLLRTVQGLRDSSPESQVIVSSAAVDVLQSGVELGEPSSVSLAGVSLGYRTLLRLSSAHRSRHALPLIGRQEEKSLLLSVCRKATQGAGKLVLLQGEPGIGKSRLLDAVREELGDKLRWTSVRATPDTSHTPLSPIGDLLTELLGLKGSLADERLARAQSQLHAFGLAPADVLPYMDTLLRVPLSERELPPAWESPEKRREATLTKVLQLLQRYSEKVPQVIVLEDAHWADASTLELLERLAARLNNFRMALLVSARTEFSRPGLAGPHVTVLQLGALTREESAELVSRASGREQLEPALLEGILSRADGVPLFLEHVVRALRLGPGEGVKSDAPIPTSLRDLFAAQLHRVGADRAPLEVAATIGREFELPLLCRAARLSSEQGAQLLQRLATQGLVEPAPTLEDQETWQFRHALIRDAAYEAMLKPRRQLLHAEVLEALSTSSPRTGTERPELLARHAEGAGALERALELWRRAAARWAGRHALQEADQGYGECLRLLHTLPQSEERDARELEILSARGAIQQALYGYAAPPVAATYERADELCHSLESVPFPVIRGVWNVHVVKGDKPATLKYADRIGSLLAAERLTRLDRNMAHNCLGTFYWFSGEFQRCLHHYEAAGYQLQDHAAMVAKYGGCGGAYAAILGPYARAALGSVDRARAEAAEITAAMATQGDPFSHAMAELYELMLDRELGELERAYTAADALLARCLEHRFAQLLPLAAIAVAARKVHQEQDLEALKSIRDNLTALGAVGARTPAAYWLAWLAEALLAVGAATDAWGALEHALAASATGLDHFYDPELYRLKATVAARLGQPSANVLALLEQSLLLAQEREHALFELKTACDLSPLLTERGERERARQVLTDALGKVEPTGAALLTRARALRDAL